MHHGQSVIIAGPHNHAQLLAEWPGIKSGGGHSLGAQRTSQHLWVAQLHYLAIAAGLDVFLCIMGSQ